MKQHVLQWKSNQKCSESSSNQYNGNESFARLNDGFNL